MKIYLQKKIRGLFPIDGEGQDYLKKIGENDIVRVEIRKPRNVKHHRKYWALMNLVFDNLPHELEESIKSVGELHYEMKLQTGHRELHTTLGGQQIWKAKSIKFSDMDQDEFAEFYDAALDVVAKFILPGVDLNELTNQVTEQI